MDSSGCTDLSFDVLSVISTFLTKNSDYIRFRSVCTEWRCAAVPQPHHLSPQLPLLLLDGARVLGPSSKTCVHNTSLLCETAGKRCYASSHGWLLLSGGDSPDVVLFNPITRTKISLPPLTSLPFVTDHVASGVGLRYSIPHVGTFTGKQMRLSSNPSLDDNFTAMAIITSTSVGFWKRGRDKTWITTDLYAHIWDISHSDKLFYSLDISARVIVWDEESRTRIATLSLTIILPGLKYEASGCYLVATSDGFVVVKRCVSYKYCGEVTTQFEVYEVDFDSTVGAIPRRTMALTNQALFVGEQSSLAVPSAACGFPKENSVYFVDYSNEKHWMKVFDLVDGSVEVLAEVDISRHPPASSAIWFTPSLC